MENLAEMATRDGNGLAVIGVALASGWLGALLLRRLRPIVRSDGRFGTGVLKSLLVLWFFAAFDSFVRFFYLSGMSASRAEDLHLNSPSFELIRWWFLVAFPLAVTIDHLDRSRYAAAVYEYCRTTMDPIQDNLPLRYDPSSGRLQPLPVEKWRREVWSELMSQHRKNQLLDWPLPSPGPPR